MEDTITELIELPKRLVDGFVGSESLKEILLGMCSLIQRQQQEINLLKSDVSQKAQEYYVNTQIMSVKDEIRGVSTYLTEVVKKHDEEVAEIKNSIEEKEHTIHADVINMKHEFNNQLDSLQSAIDSVRELSIVVSKKVDREVATMKEEVDKSNELSTALRNKISDIGIDSMEHINYRLDEAEAKVSNYSNTVTELSNRIETVSKGYQTAINELRSDTTTEFGEIKAGMRFSTNQQKFDFPEEFNIDKADYSQIMRLIYRNSKRIDAIDQQASTIRIEVENLGVSMTRVHNCLQRFALSMSHQQRAFENNKSNVVARFKNMRNFFSWIGSNFKSVWSALSKITSHQQHTTLTMATSSEQIYSILSNISLRPLPNAVSFDELVLESNIAEQRIRKKKDELEFEKQFILVSPIFGDPKVDETPMSIEKIIEYVPTMPRKVPKPIYDADAATAVAVIESNEDPMIIVMMEDLLSRVKDLEESLPSSFERLENNIKAVDEVVKTKIDARSVDAVFRRFQRELDKASRQYEIGSKELAKTSRDPVPTLTARHHGSKLAVLKQNNKYRSQSSIHCRRLASNEITIL